MQSHANKHRRTDYTQQLHPRRHSVDGLIAPAARPAAHPVTPGHHPKPVPRHNDDEEYRVSININLPDYNQWRITKFARRYPYLSILIAFLGLLAVALFMELMVNLWQALRHHPVQPALIFNPKIL